MTAPTRHPLVDIIDSDSLSAGWQCIAAVVEWLQHASEDERLEAYPLVRTRIPDREPWYHVGLQLAIAGTAPRVQDMVPALADIANRVASEVATVVALRPRTWLPDLADRWLKASPASARATLDLLVERGIIARPTQDAYVIAMPHGGGFRNDAAAIRGLLLTEPSTAGADVLTMLRAPGIGETLYRVDSGWSRFRIDEDTWIWQIAILVDEGGVDRSAVLDVCLRELGRPAEREPAIWFTGMYQHLKPTADDIEPFTAQLIGLLHAERSATVTLAQASLLLLVRTGRLDPCALLHASTAPLGRDEKGLVLAQLRMLDLAGANHPELRAEVVERARVALQHPRTDVQDAALKLIRRHGTIAELSDDDRAALSPALASAAGIAPDASGADARLDGCAVRVATLPAAVRERWALDAAVADARAGRFPSLAPPPPTMGEPLGPLTDDPVEFAAVLGELCEREADPLQWQQVLAAAVRTATLPPATRAAAWRPYARARRRSLPFNHYMPHPQELAQMLGAAWGEQRRRGRTNERVVRPVDVATFITVDCAALIHDRPGTRLLSEPTHTTAAIDPETLLSRLHGVPHDHPELDVELAALRLPRGLDEAFWQDAEERDRATATRLRRHYRRQVPPALVVSTDVGRDEWGRPFARVEVDTDRSCAPVALDDPASGVWDALLDVQRRRVARTHFRGYSDTWVHGWNAIAPWHCDLIAAHLLPILRHGIDNDNTSNPAPRSAAELDAPTGTLGPVGHVGLVLALQGGTATTRTPAADVWFAVASDGRLDPTLAGEAITLLHRGGQLKLNRVIESVAPTVAKPVVAARTLLALTSAAPKLVDAKARHLHLLFELAADLAARVGTTGVPASLLSDMPGGSSALQVARRRLAAAQSSGPEGPNAAAGELEALLDGLG
jgi:hypothetical protein